MKDPSSTPAPPKTTNDTGSNNELDPNNTSTMDTTSHSMSSNSRPDPPSWDQEPASSTSTSLPTNYYQQPPFVSPSTAYPYGRNTGSSAATRDDVVDPTSSMLQVPSAPTGGAVWSQNMIDYKRDAVRDPTQDLEDRERRNPRPPPPPQPPAAAAAAAVPPPVASATSSPAIVEAVAVQGDTHGPSQIMWKRFLIVFFTIVLAGLIVTGILCAGGNCTNNGNSNNGGSGASQSIATVANGADTQLQASDASLPDPTPTPMPKPSPNPTTPAPTRLYDVDYIGSPQLSDLWDVLNSQSRTLPTQLGLFSNARKLDLDWDELTGPIPSELGMLTKLTSLQLWNNQLTGSIPTTLGLLTSMTSLDLSGNSLTGRIPSELGMLTSLTSLYLLVNNLSGDMPQEVCSLSKNYVLRTLWLDELEVMCPMDCGC